MKHLKKLILITILVGILSQGFLGFLTASAQILPPPQAQSLDTTKSIIIGGLSCAAGGLLSKWLSSLINKGLESILKFTQNILSKLPVVGLFMNTNVPTDDLNQKASNIGSVIARCFARQILNHMTAGIVGAARTSGRGGSPAFVRDWHLFKLIAQRRGENVFRSILNSTDLCPYFSGNIKTLFKAGNQPAVSPDIMRVSNLDPYIVRGRCTMPYGWSLKNYQTDFSGNGGWNALVSLNQPQNNFYGNLLMSMSEVSLQRAAHENSDLSSVIAGLGFDSRRGRNPTTPVTGYCSNATTRACTTNLECDSYQTIQQSYCSNDVNTACITDNTCTALGDPYAICVYPQKTNKCIMSRDDCAIRSSNGDCAIYNQVLTPGSVLQNTVSGVINNELSWLSNVTTMDAIISDLTRLVLSRVLNLSEPDDSRQEAYPREVYPGPSTPPGSPPCAYTGDADNPSNPGFYDPNVPCPSPSSAPPPPILAFCDNSDVDGDGSLCDASIGEDNFTCPSDCPPVAECQNGIDDDGDGFTDAPGIGLNPDPNCSSPFDNSESGSAITFQCNDGIDNDGDIGQPGGGIDYPADSSCTSATDDSEITLIVTLCGGTNYSQPCQQFSSSNQDLGNPMTTIGPDNAESFTGTPIIYNPIFIVELCVDPGYGNCTTITSAMLSPPGQVAGGISDLNSIPSIGRNTVQSIRVCQNGQDPATRACLP